MEKLVTQKDRNYGIDLLRILSMFLVLLVHVLGQGGILNSTKELTLNYEVTWLLEIIGYCAVGCYALISGYVGVNSKFKYENIIKITLQVVFYTFFTTLIFKFIRPEIVSLGDIIKSLFPYAFNHYWYFTSYFCIFFFFPFFNKLVNTMNRSDSKKFVILVVILFSIMPIVFYGDIFKMEWGYTPVWIAILYIVGAMIKKYNIKNSKKFYNNVFYLSILFTFFFKLATDLLTMHFFKEIRFGWILISYTSPTILLASISLLIVFSNLKVGLKMKKFISFFAPLSFGVYLIHAHPLVWEYILKDRFVTVSSLNPILLLLYIIGLSVGIYLICILIDFIRSKLFNLFKIDMGIRRVTSKILNIKKDHVE